MKRNVHCAYNKFFFEKIYRFMIDNQVQVAFDPSDTLWNILDVEDILIKEYGYKRASHGGIV